MMKTIIHRLGIMLIYFGTVKLTLVLLILLRNRIEKKYSVFF